MPGIASTRLAGVRIVALDEEHERDPDFGWLMLPPRAEEPASPAVHRITALRPKQVSGRESAPAPVFASCATD